ncbi:MAG: PH domain-containing protein [Longimicrobiales bacterium]
MALQACRECGSQVSTEAESCPRCGVPNPSRAVVARAPGGHETINASYASADSMTREEAPIYRAHVHWSIYLNAVLVLLVAGVPLFFDDPSAKWIALVLVAAAAVLGIIAYIKGSSTEFVITTRRLIAKRGIVSRKTIETLLEKVEAVSVEQTLFGRIFNYGTVTVQGTGGTKESFAMVSKPLELRKVIHEQIDSQRSNSPAR